MSIEVTTVQGWRQLSRFIDVPHDLYRGDRSYVPQLAMHQKEVLGPKSGFLEHGRMQLFVALRRGRRIGRVAAIVNGSHDTFHGERKGFFGFFDCEDDPEAASRMLEACRSWLEGQGHSGLCGPVNPDLNNSAGVLTDGFDRRPVVFMPYNAPYYAKLLEAAGLSVVKRLNAWDLSGGNVPERAFRYADRAQGTLKARGVVVRSLDRSRLETELRGLRRVYNVALADSWGYAPLTEAELSEQARALKFLCPRDFIQVAEHEGHVVGFIGAVPDWNQVLHRIARGRLLPWGWVRLLTGRRRIDWARIIMYGVDPRYRGTGLATWLYVAITRVILGAGLRGAEASYVLEDNHAVNRLVERLGGQRTRRYAIYDLPGGEERRDESQG